MSVCFWTATRDKLHHGSMESWHPASVWHGNLMREFICTKCPRFQRFITSPDRDFSGPKDRVRPALRGFLAQVRSEFGYLHQDRQFPCSHDRTEYQSGMIERRFDEQMHKTSSESREKVTRPDSEQSAVPSHTALTNGRMKSQRFTSTGIATFRCRTREIS
jgi:hypothetical protein